MTNLTTDTFSENHAVVDNYTVVNLISSEYFPNVSSHRTLPLEFNERFAENDNEYSILTSKTYIRKPVGDKITKINLKNGAIIKKIKLIDMPTCQYHFQINAINIATSKNNEFNFNNANPLITDLFFINQTDLCQEKAISSTISIPKIINFNTNIINLNFIGKKILYYNKNNDPIYDNEYTEWTETYDIKNMFILYTAYDYIYKIIIHVSDYDENSSIVFSINNVNLYEIKNIKNNTIYLYIDNPNELSFNETKHCPTNYLKYLCRFLYKNAGSNMVVTQKNCNITSIDTEYYEIYSKNNNKLKYIYDCRCHKNYLENILNV